MSAPAQVDRAARSPVGRNRNRITTSPLLAFTGKRLVTSAITLLGMIVVVFLIVRVLPGDPAAARAGPYVTEAQLIGIRHEYGLDRPLYAQFVTYVQHLAQGNLGTSVQTNQPVADEVFKRLPASLELAVYAAILATVTGVLLGGLAAARARTWTDGAIRGIAVLGNSMALFWLGLVLIYLLAYTLQWFPGPVARLPVGTAPPPRVTGFYVPDALVAGDFGLAWTAARYLMLPVITLAVVVSAPIIKVTRLAMITALDADYVRTAKAMGVPRRQILASDALRNAMLPIITTVGIAFGYMLGGSIIVETLFSWPGIGRLAYQAIQTSDLEVLQGVVLAVGTMYIILNVVVDIAYALADPRIRLGQRVAR
jgi:ABC-type dipeptide/oligopeptide/nickel transport system permease component